MTTPTYRSINLTATLLGIDRRLCIVILLIGFLVFRHGSFLSALVAFGLLWSMAYWITNHDIQLIVIVPKALRQKKVYDPARLTPADHFFSTNPSKKSCQIKLRSANREKSPKIG